MSTKQEIKCFIERKRKVMILAANHYGLSADITVKYSQELDELINQYNSLTLKKEELNLSDCH